MARSIQFYRLLGLDVPETPDEGHVDAFLPNGVRFMLDSEEVMRSFMPDWTRENGNQIGIALECGSPAEVDEVYARGARRGLRVDEHERSGRPRERDVELAQALPLRSLLDDLGRLDDDHVVELHALGLARRQHRDPRVVEKRARAVLAP